MHIVLQSGEAHAKCRQLACNTTQTMSDYDFKTLNDKEFEILCADLLAEVEGRKFERFKAGKDGGVDGRFFTVTGGEVILQCKHWATTDTKKLIKKLSTEERPKVEKLKPARYILAISKPLSRADKKAIKQALDPYLLSEADIFGNEDLNDILKANGQIERRHYKLWLQSSEVLRHILNSAIHGRSTFSFEEIRDSAHKYVITANHRMALEQLDRLGAVIITGEPGVGKTTLADHLCLRYVADGFSYLKIGDDIAEAESAFEKDEKQIFYFDDFLGRNYLEALTGHEGARIVQFFRRITANRDKKRFVLTSRSTILNQGKLLIDSFEHQNLQRNEYELQIKSLSELDKAQILYNHIWHSGLQHDYVEQLYAQKRYRGIISHRNFNPRLISYITDETRLDNVPPTEYWQYVVSSLNNPAHIWDNPFEAQQDDFGRAIVFLVVMNGRSILESQLSEAYARFIALPENQTMRGRRAFQTNLRTLIGSLLNRIILPSGETRIDLFNPSIGDYVLKRYSGDVVSVRQAALSLYTLSSLRTLLSTVSSMSLTEPQRLKIFEAVLRQVVAEDFRNTDIAFLSDLCELILLRMPRYRENGTDILLSRAVHYLIPEADGIATDSTFNAIRLAQEENMVSAEAALKLVEANLHVLVADDDIAAVTSLLNTLPSTTEGISEIRAAVKNQVIELASGNLEEFVELSTAFQSADYKDYERAQHNLAELIEKKFDDLGIKVESDDIDMVIRYFDVDDEFDRYHERHYDAESDGYESPQPLVIDEIDDLFDRG